MALARVARLTWATRRLQRTLFLFHHTTRFFNMDARFRSILVASVSQGRHGQAHTTARRHLGNRQRHANFQVRRAPHTKAATFRRMLSKVAATRRFTRVLARGNKVGFVTFGDATGGRHPRATRGQPNQPRIRISPNNSVQQRRPLIMRRMEG